MLLAVDDYVSKSLKEPVISLYGVDAVGEVVIVNVHDFRPYFFVIPNKETFSDRELGIFTQSLNQQMADAPKQPWLTLDRYVLSTERASGRSIRGYTPDSRLFLRITFVNPKIMPIAEKILRDTLKMQIFESNITPLHLRFMIDHNIRGGGWVELEAYQYRFDGQDRFNVSYENVLPRNDILEIAPVRILTFDIECQAPEKRFPQADSDPVIQIANIVCVYGQDEPLMKNVFVLHGCDPIDGCVVYEFDTEEELLLSWSRYINAVNPGKLVVLFFFCCFFPNSNLLEL